jgi:Bacterial Ig-like domain
VELHHRAPPDPSRPDPGINAREVARTANVRIRFSEKVSAVSGSSLMLVTTSGRTVAAVVSYNRTTGVATLNPVRTLAPGTRYTVVVTNAIKDRAGNRLSATRWSFTTA